MPINGTSGDDRLRGSWRADEMNGFEGNDVFEGSGGGDAINGGAGKDTVDYSHSLNTGYYTITNPYGFTYTTPYNGVVVDLMSGEGAWGLARGDTYTSIESVIGSSYNDEIRGSDSSNMLLGGSGDDFIDGNGGGDLLDGGAGIDIVAYTYSDAGVKINLLNSTATGGDASGDTIKGFEGIHGSRFSDVLTGSNADNSINGRSGDDKIFGLDGADKLDGSEGNDIIDGGAGDDIIWGGMNTNILTGGQGADTFRFGLNSETYDIITDFETGLDKIVIDVLDPANPSVHHTYSGGTLFLSYQAWGSTCVIEVQDVASAQEAMQIVSAIEVV
jgi:Ca2+-binding RTX toxin-like protein